MTECLSLCDPVNPAMLQPGDKFSILRKLGTSICFKESYIVVNIEPLSRTVQGRLEQRFIGHWDELPLGRCDLETDLCIFDFNDHYNILTDK